VCSSDLVLVRRVDADEKSAGGIIIPDTAQEKPMQGEILAAARDGGVNPIRLCFGNVERGRHHSIQLKPARSIIATEELGPHVPAV